jgi:hypothetical protein
MCDISTGQTGHRVFRCECPQKDSNLRTWLLAAQCEWCRQTDPVEAHQVRKLADLARTGQPQPEWARLMTRKQRNALIVPRGR